MSRDRIIQVYRGTTAQNDAFTGAAGEITMDTTRKELRVHDGSTAGGNLVGLKPGFVCPFAGTTAPDGWLICDGSAVSRTTYADLFAVIGTTYGAGDGNSTFNLPNLNYAVPMWRADSTAIGNYWAGTVPNITGGFGIVCNGSDSATTRWYAYGALYQETTAVRNVGSSGNNANGHGLAFNANRVSGVYDPNNTGQVFPANIKMYYIVKY